MKPALILLLTLVLTACSSGTKDTHNPSLLDEKVAEERVATALRRADHGFRNVRVTSEKGVVILSGKVSSPELRERAEAIARQTPDAGRVEDQIVVGR